MLYSKYVPASFSVIAYAILSTTVLASVISGPEYYNGHAYYLLSQNSWTESEVEAQALGGHLATINNSDENNWVYDTFTENGARSCYLWIGYNDVLNEGTFTWVNGENSTFNNWWGTEPNEYYPDEDYVFIWGPPLEPQQTRYWFDLRNLNGFNNLPLLGVAEIIPEPSAILHFAIIALVGLVAGMMRKLQNK